MHSFEELILSPVLSTVTGLLLLSGLSGLGFLLLKGLNINQKIHRIHDCLIGAVIGGQLTFLCVLSNQIVFISFFGYCLLIIGIGYLYTFRITILKIFEQIPLHLLLLLLIGFFLLSLSPLTNADSIDYHLGIPIYISKYGFLPDSAHWFHSRLFGFGELTNYLGLSIGTEKIGSLLQFMSLASISHIVSSNFSSDSNSMRRFFVLAVLSPPLLIFLIGTAKFQIFPIALIILSVSLIINRDKYEGGLKGFFIIIFLAVSAPLYKFNFLLSGFLVTCFSFFTFWQREMIRHNLNLLFFGAVLFLTLMLPFFYFKAGLFNSNLLTALFSPIIGDFIGSENFLSMLRNYKDSSVPFPFSLVFPSGIGEITTVIGLGISLILLITRRTIEKNLMLVTLILCFCFSLLLFAQYTSRSFLEVYFLLILLISRSQIHNLKFFKVVKVSIYSQALLTSVLLYYGVASSIPGIFSDDRRVEVMNKLSNGFEIMNWIDKNVDRSSNIVVTNRSMTFSKNNMISGDWMDYVDWSTNQPINYIREIDSDNKTYLFFFKNDQNQANIPESLISCLGPSMTSKKFRTATRNPFNKSEIEVNIVEFNRNETINCLLEKIS